MRRRGNMPLLGREGGSCSLHSPPSPFEDDDVIDTCREPEHGSWHIVSQAQLGGGERGRQATAAAAWRDTHQEQISS